MPWDPGVHSVSLCRISRDPEVGAAAAIGDRIDRAIAWGQAMFLGGGIVTLDTLGKMGLGFMGRQYRWMAIKGAAGQEERASKKQNRKSESLPCPHSSAPAPSPSGPVATTSHQYLPAHAPISTGGQGSVTTASKSD